MRVKFGAKTTNGRNGAVVDGLPTPPSWEVQIGLSLRRLRIRKDKRSYHDVADTHFHSPPLPALHLPPPICRRHVIAIRKFGPTISLRHPPVVQLPSGSPPKGHHAVRYRQRDRPVPRLLGRHVQFLPRRIVPAQIQIQDQRLHIRKQTHELDRGQRQSVVLVAQHCGGY